MKKHLLHVSPLLLGAACALLAMIIGVFAITNFKREKQLMEQALQRQVDSVARIITSGVRFSVLKSFRDGVEFVQIQNAVQYAIEQAKEQEGVESVFVVNENGDILAGASDRKFDKKISQKEKNFLKKISRNHFQGFQAREPEKLENGIDIMQFGLFFDPVPPLKSPQMRRPDHMEMEYKKRRFGSRFKRFEEKVRESFGEERLFLLINLELNRFNSALDQQKKQLLALSFILLLVGVGGWLSLMTVQGLRGSQSRLAQMRAFTDRLISAVPVGIIGVAGDGFIRLVNPEVLKILEVDDVDIIDKEFKAVLGTLYKDVEASLLERRNIEVDYTTSENKLKKLYLNSVQIQDESGNSDGFVVLLQDLTEQRKLEEDVQRNARLASLGKVAAGVAHELRNPLSSIKGLGTLLQSRFSQGSDDRHTADVLVAEIERLNRSIGELLDYAKPQESDFSEVSLQECVKKAVSLVQYDADDLGIAINLKLGEKDLMVQGNSDKLNQVFLNLLLNSIQAIDGEDGEIVISCNADSANYQVIIEDNGTGIDADIVSKVFDPYFTTKPEGTGLGLSICNKIVQDHGAELKLENRSERGCRTVVTFPV